MIPEDKVSSDEYPRVTMQTLIDCGLNAFAVQMLSESIADSVNKHLPVKSIKFRFDNVGITITPLNDKADQA